jgi:hypothetical protein
MSWLSPLGSYGVTAQPGEAPVPVTTRGAVLFDSGAVAAGAVIDTGILDLTEVGDLFFVAYNAATGLARNLTMDSYLDDGTTAIDTGHVLRQVAVGAVTERGTVGVHAPSAVSTAPALTFSRPGPLPPKAEFHLVAAGAAAARLTIFRR